MRNIIFIFGLPFIVSCAGSPMVISMKSPEGLKTVPDEQLSDVLISGLHLSIDN